MKINPILKQWLKREVDTFHNVYMRRDATALEIAMITGLQHQSLIEIDQIVDNGNSHDYIRYSLTALGIQALNTPDTATETTLSKLTAIYAEHGLPDFAAFNDGEGLNTSAPDDSENTAGDERIGYHVKLQEDTLRPMLLHGHIRIDHQYTLTLPKSDWQVVAALLNTETNALRTELAAANAKIAALEAELLESKQYRKLLEATLTSCKQLYDGEQDKLAKLYRENDRLQDRVDDLNNMVDEARIERDSLKAKLAECQHARELASTQRDAATELYSGKHSRLEDVKRELEAKDERIAGLEAVIETVHARLINAKDKIPNHVNGTGYLDDAIETIEAELPDID